MLGEPGLEAIRQAAIGADWSPLRFQRVEFIQAMNRDEQWAMTEQGKKRVGS